MLLFIRFRHISLQSALRDFSAYLRGKQSVGIRAIHVLSFIIQCGDDKRITEMGVGALQIFAFTDIINFLFSKLQYFVFCKN